MRKIIGVLGLLSVAFMAGCGSSGSSAPATQVSGAVADGYLQNAQVFLDKNGNYQLDAGEPSTMTDANGAYTLSIDPADVGKYPIVAVAIKDQTIDKDTGLAVPNSYVLCTPAAGVSGTVSNFISPMSTLLREKLEANPGMTLAEAMTQLRNQLNMPVGMNMTGDYVAGSMAGQYQQQYQEMHQVAQQMAGLMGAESGLVMNGNNVNMGRFRSMMGQINQNMPQITDNVGQGLGMSSTFMNSMKTQMQTTLGGMPAASGFMNYSGGRMTPGTGMMSGSAMR
ncbi:hypothetical protein KI809_08095 [Geobacter pelophilus]|uniref:Lipoprotein n=1 Tax=Geoanaerobacter pelophilus TaxID=60036 RepID=A0AAW4L003_9BACT|nr:hypothetical protein [Geoanaerobacter pelophilus]MBT0664261.1 hypothetical protein [Geoanaerobacter pelophilus]